MATDKQFIEELTEGLREVRVRPMMGDYVLYCRDKVVGDVCDNSLYIKITPASRELLSGTPEVPPYGGTKPFFLTEPRDKAFLQKLLFAVADDLPLPAKRKK